MNDRQLTSRRNCFARCGLDPQLYDQLYALFTKHLLTREPGAKEYVENPARLKEVFEVMRDAWEETVYPVDQPALAIDQIPFDELYSLPGYLTALLECWHNWTIKSMSNTIWFVKQHPELQQECLVAADGFGAASFMWALSFPQLPVRAHIMGEAQYGLCKDIKDELHLANLEVVADTDVTSGLQAKPSAPVVLAFETFEHFYEPMKFVEPLVADTKLLVYSAPWGVRAHGHFRQYKLGGDVVPNNEVSRVFSAWLKSLGFVSSAKSYNFSFFNGYPRVYTRL